MTDRLASVPVPIIPWQSPPPERQTNNLDGAIWLYHSISVWSDIHTADHGSSLSVPISHNGRFRSSD